MTNKSETVRVPRDLLERLAYGEWECASLKDRDTLRALLAAPAEDIRAVGEEPVACRVRFLRGESPEIVSWNEQADGVHNFYRRPQRPVVLPEKMPKGSTNHQRALYEGWNACLDEFEGLNK